MMNQRRVYGLLVVAVVVIAGAFWLSHATRNPDRSSVAGQPALEGLKAALNEVTEIRIAKGDSTHVTLRKRAADWEVAEREYTADSGKVRKLLLDLGGLEIVEEKTSDPASYARIGVEDVNSPKATGTRLEAVTPKKVFGLIAGKPGGMKAAYVRVAGAKQSLLASPQLAPDADPKRWLDHTMFDIPEARVKEVAVTPASGPPYTVTREKKEQSDFTVTNIPKGRELASPGAGNAAAGELASFTLDDVRHAPAATDAAAKPAASATFRTFDGLELQVDGFKDGDHHYIAIAPHSTAKETATEAQTLETRLKSWQFEIPGYKYDAMFRPLDELLKKPEPKPAAKPAAKPGKKPAAGPAAPVPPASQP